MSKNKYESLGVSASKSGLHKVLQNTGLEDSLGLFAQVSPDLAGSSDHYSVIHCDGAGTKTIVPYVYFKETGSRKLFGNLAQDALVMNLDDIYCIGAPERMVLANAIARNARLIDDDCLQEIIGGYKTLTEELQALDIPLTMSGGETADCGDVVRSLVVDAVITARIAKSAIIDANRIAPGDAIIGISSTGKATYERNANSGIGSNGLTLARHSLLSSEVMREYPEIVDPQTDAEVAYRGPYRAADRPAELEGMSVAEALASPTRTYAPILQKIYEALGTNIHGVIHLTGGAQTKMLRFGKGVRYVKEHFFPVPPLFQLIQRHGQVSWKEMYQVFNMGHRLEIYCNKSDASSVMGIAHSFGLEAKQIGHVEANPNDSGSNELLLRSEFGEFTYSL